MATVYVYFERALRRPPAPVLAEPVFDDDQSVAFQLEERDGIVTTAAYRCTSCVTLMALSQHASELAAGRPLSGMAAVTAELLLALHPEIPEARKGRSGLVVRALQQAVEHLRRNKA